jgi:hypothetical protein
MSKYKKVKTKRTDDLLEYAKEYNSRKPFVRSYPRNVDEYFEKPVKRYVRKNRYRDIE